MHMDETRLVEIALYETALDDIAMNETVLDDITTLDETALDDITTLDETALDEAALHWMNLRWMGLQRIKPGTYQAADRLLSYAQPQGGDVECPMYTVCTVDMLTLPCLQGVSCLPGLRICRRRQVYRVSPVCLACGYAGAARFTGCLMFAWPADMQVPPCLQGVSCLPGLRICRLRCSDFVFFLQFSRC
jgi:hypothetical protein